ncbi:MAG: hypothetical protein QG608_998 [Actinomycetota bacterium]|nr:hypothetical protein [Actinomycetota bacterium]
MAARPGQWSRTGPWLIWSIGLTAYVLAVLHRTSFGVAGLVAIDRYHLSAALLSGFMVLQLIVYAGLQIPVGLLLDRYGPRRLIVAGGVTMACGQMLMAVSTTVALAYAGRALVGAGDAMTFISVLRLVVRWFPSRHVPLVSQLTGLIGQVGQVLSAVPFAALLRERGWTSAFGAIAVLGLLVAVLSLAGLPTGRHWADPDNGPVTRARVLGDLVAAWRHPGTRLGLWTHFVTQFPPAAFALAWGYPFLIHAQGTSAQAAGRLLSLLALAGIVCGPLLGVLAQRFPRRRSLFVLLIVASTTLLWTAVLAWPGRAPVWLLILLVLGLSAGGPGAMIGFDFARTYNPPARLGTATGIVNVGGFTSTFVTIFLIGLLLDLRGTGGTSAEGFRAAFAAQYVLWAIGIAGVLRSRSLLRRRESSVTLGS